MRKFLVVLVLLTNAARAEVPVVLTDIAPVHSLAALVMGDLGAPGLLLDAQSDPHHVQMRPSQARLMANADLVIWMGAAMTPWLDRVIDTLAQDAAVLELLELDALPMRIEGNVANIQAPDTGLRTDSDSGDLATPPETQTDHSHGSLDPHAWLDPLNAVRFLDAIAGQLGALDLENSEAYHANAVFAGGRITALVALLKIQLAPQRRATLVSYHDAYRYFFFRFSLRAQGSISPSDAAPPSAARIAGLRDFLAKAPQVCVFSEPGANLKLIAAVLPEGGRPPPMLDPLGAALTPGPELYEALIGNMAATILTCAP